ncbi:MAG: metallophosphoesterase family protein [Oscillospiraceae bacterium]
MSNKVTFGLFADAQYALCSESLGRQYGRSMEKVGLYLDIFRREQADFIVHLGDLIDDSGAETGRALHDITSLVESGEIPCHYLLGNHDVDMVDWRELTALWHYPGSLPYYSFNQGDIHFVVLNSNCDEAGKVYLPTTGKWDRCFLDGPQLKWLEDDFSRNRQPLTVVFVHALLDELDDPHVIINAGEARRILEGSGGKLLVFQGHMHSGRRSETRGIPYYTLPGTVQGDTFCCWVVEVEGEEVRARIYTSLDKAGEECILF